MDGMGPDASHDAVGVPTGARTSAPSAAEAPPGGVRTLSVVARTKPAPPDRGSTDDGRQAGQGCGRRKSREHCGPRLKLTWEFPGFLCARGDLNPHALSDTGT